MQIVVASHDNEPPRRLPYIVVNRENVACPGIHYPSVTWSEYAAFLSVYPTHPMFGLESYRCTFKNYTESKINVTSVEFPTSCYEQFKTHHASLAEILLLTSDYFKSLTNIDAICTLKNSNVLHHRNMFYAPRAFAIEWQYLATKLITFMDRLQVDTETERWGAFILERLFSTFVDTHIYVVQECVYTKEIKVSNE